jgi:hypothetical protein
MQASAPEVRGNFVRLRTPSSGCLSRMFYGYEKKVDVAVSRF